MKCHLIMVKRCANLCGPRNCIVLPMVGSAKVRSQSKCDSQDPLDEENNGPRYCSQNRIIEATLCIQFWGRGLSHKAQPECAVWASPHVGLHIQKRPQGSIAVRSQGFGGCDLQLLKLDFDTWNVTSRVEREPKLVHEAERYQLDIVGLT